MVSMIRRLWDLLNGPNTFTTKNPFIFWGIFTALCLYYVFLPWFSNLFAVINWTNYLAFLGVALGLSFLWGYLGILSFGQMAFFGIAGYVYGIIGINLLRSWGAVPGTLTAVGGSLLSTALVAAVFGYFIFYGRVGVSRWIIPILTLAFTLLLETFMGQTAGYQYRIGRAYLGGYNGMRNIPTIFELGDVSFYYVVLGLAIFMYLGLRIIVNSGFGHQVLSVRENELRANTLGTNVRLVNLLVFVISAVMAGVSGILYVSWGRYIDPSSMGLVKATLPVIWVAIGGRASLTSVVIMTLSLQYLSQKLAVFGGQYGLIIYGGVLLLGMVFTPRGLFTTIFHSIPGFRTNYAEPE